MLKVEIKKKIKSIKPIYNLAKNKKKIQITISKIMLKLKKKKGTKHCKTCFMSVATLI